MNSQVYSYCIFHNTCIHTDSYIVGKTDIKSKIGKEERKKKKRLQMRSLATEFSN